MSEDLLFAVLVITWEVIALADNIHNMDQWSSVPSSSISCASSSLKGLVASTVKFASLVRPVGMTPCTFCQC